MKKFGKIALTLLVGTLSACAPRGENNSVDEVLKTKRADYLSQSANAALDPQASSALQKISAQLATLSGTQKREAIPASAREVAELLSALTNKAGYTSRAALTEIAAQYRALSESSDIENQTVKLLVARTYSLLTSEIETSKFSL